MNVVGIDSCRIGWCVIGYINKDYVFGCYTSIDKLIKEYPSIDRMLIDIPIGLSSINFNRTVDKLARTYLLKRKSSIFTPPCRETLTTKNYKEALLKNRQICGVGISIQAYNILKKIYEIDKWYEKKPNNLLVYEAHPELCFQSLNKGKSIHYSKHQKVGVEMRKNILFTKDQKLNNIYNKFIQLYKRSQVKPDDILDAMALLITNKNSKKLKYIQDCNTLDETQKSVRIVYA